MWRRTITCGLLLTAAGSVILALAPTGAPAGPMVGGAGWPRWAVVAVAWAVPLLPVLFVPLLVLAIRPHPQRALPGLLVAAAGAALTLAIGSVLKDQFQGVRPCAAPGADRALLSCPPDWSYPSTISGLVAAVAVGVAVISRRLAVTAAVLAALCAAGRVLGGVHSVPDVLAGLVLGAAVAGALALWVPAAVRTPV
ncbi:phosphatase PAP2 family protein [Catenuloplanes atrovinosus]|uniref:Membrane-associated phospholipid phosphatase n=1 Tax=Catenuloplanes atrovinosus TaxID=137266 RepID=A0AAE3YQ81_9ACTN|nr:phosphatase PAP2 family protein [Catenuloplanes atrovinosus]MDR7276423.1 membrane-associated phospholipid phosphatase [Catenuloplanes atrovinosus]